MKRSCDALRAFHLIRRAELCQSVADIFFYGKVREGGQRLKNVGQFAALRRERDFACGVEANSLAEADFTGVGLLQACDAIEEGGFPRAGGAEQNGEAGRERSSGIKNERLRTI